MMQTQALRILKTGANVFLTGEPGAGKTHTINTYVAYLRDHGIEPAITASTGIAATHIHGQTIHSWSGIGIRKSLSPYDIDHIATTEYLVRRMRGTAVLIIDEISMIDASTLDMVDAVCRAVRQQETPFGGMQVVLVGDFFQLPPIKYVGQEARFAFDAQVWQEMQPVVCYLTEQFRHNDETFFSILKAIRGDTYDHVHHDLLTKRFVADDADVEAFEHIPRLFSRNVDVDAINTATLEKIPRAPNMYQMIEKGSKALVASLKKGCLSPEQLVLKIGAAVMCTKNNQAQKYVNGTLGTVIDFEAGTKYPIIETRSGERITIVPAEWVIEEDGKRRASITQIPLRLAWAITIHKSQGMSLDAAIMDLGEVFEYGQGYVALSRVRSLEGVYLTGWNQRAMQVHPRIQAIDERFVSQSRAAEAAFGDMPASQLGVLHNRFILSAGGTVDPKKKKNTKQKKVPTLDATLMLLLQGKNIKTIAEERGLGPATIYAHLEKLAAAKRYSREDIDHLIDEPLRRALPDIKATFITRDTSALSPVYEHYKGRHSYDALRLARIAIALS